MANGVYGAGMNVAIAGATANQSASPVAVTGVAGGTTNPITVAPFVATTATNSAAATAPTAGTNIVTLASGSLPAGNYKVQVWLAASGTATTAAADSNNMNLLAGATTVVKFFPYNCSTAGNLTNPGAFELYLTLNGSTALIVNAVGNASAGTVYSAMILATRVS